MSERLEPGAERRRVGLCVSCVHARRIVSAKQSVFYQCGRAAADPRYRAYPPLPVTQCAGHEGPRDEPGDV